MRTLAKVVVVRARDKWYKVGQRLEVSYMPSVEAYVTKDGKIVEALDVKSVK